MLGKYGATSLFFTPLMVHAGGPKSNGGLPPHVTVVISSFKGKITVTG
jgi:hypothetical protein